ncbi:hypothetical protein OH799_14775 [Nocardia sp. NBC_00881]|uniref:hypothetical protein n=1 Tax=Nocardia sp. NBC_00881 TaxID=2975995 RepID=UPI0038705EF2|nr:hypothetical protein OH799_14775 [Nocardia sp. NBC_00881]
MIASAPDGVPCVQVATADVHRPTVDRWWPVVGSRLPEIVPAGADILIDPGGSAQFPARHHSTAWHSWVQQYR